MSTENYFVLTAEQRVSAVALNTEDVAIDPRTVNNDSPGVGINLNDNAADFDPAEAVPLTGKFVAPKRIVDDPQYKLYAPAMVEFLLDLPFCILESETIFAPEAPPF